MLVHKHLVVRAEVKNAPRDEAEIIAWISNLIRDIGMKVLIGPFAKYLDVEGNRGLTVAAIIETSHVAMHVWDETDPGLLQLDVYTCGPLDTSVIFRYLEQFEPVRVEYKYLDREHGLIEVPLE